MQTEKTHTIVVNLDELDDKAIFTLLDFFNCRGRAGLDDPNFAVDVATLHECCNRIAAKKSSETPSEQKQAPDLLNEAEFMAAAGVKQP